METLPDRISCFWKRAEGAARIYEISKVFCVCVYVVVGVRVWVCETLLESAGVYCWSVLCVYRLKCKLVRGTNVFVFEQVALA